MALRTCTRCRLDVVLLEWRFVSSGRVATVRRPSVRPPHRRRISETVAKTAGPTMTIPNRTNVVTTHRTDTSCQGIHASTPDTTSSTTATCHRQMIGGITRQALGLAMSPGYCSPAMGIHRTRWSRSWIICYSVFVPSSGAFDSGWPSDTVRGHPIPNFGFPDRYRFDQDETEVITMPAPAFETLVCPFTVPPSTGASYSPSRPDVAVRAVVRSVVLGVSTPNSRSVRARRPPDVADLRDQPPITPERPASRSPDTRFQIG